MDEKDCEMLEMLEQTGNITKAAGKLFTTQSALTKRIQKLEEELGCTLLIRSRKGIIFTPAAETILPHIRAISASMQKIHIDLASIAGDVAGTLKIGVSVNYARYRLPDVLKNYMAQYPKVDIHVNTQQSTRLYRSLKENEISIALVRGNFQWDEWIVTLREEPVCLVVANERAHTPLNQLPYIGRHTDRAFFDEIERWRQERGCYGSRVNLWIDDIGSCLAMVSRGIGWAILPAICLEGFNGLIRPLHFPDGTAFTRTSHILYRHDYFELPQVKMFIKAVLADEYFRETD